MRSGRLRCMFGKKRSEIWLQEWHDVFQLYRCFFCTIYELMDEYKANLKGVVSWSFEFEDQEWFAGFRELATHGVDKPVLNVFRMFGMMKGKRILT